MSQTFYTSISLEKIAKGMNEIIMIEVMNFLVVHVHIQQFYMHAIKLQKLYEWKIVFHVVENYDMIIYKNHSKALNTQKNILSTKCRTTLN